MKNKAAAIALPFLLFLSLLLSACAPLLSATPAIPSGKSSPIGVRGRITSRTESGNRLHLMIEGEKTVDTLYDSAAVTVTESTLIQDQSGPVTRDDLQVGAIAEVRFSGPVAESYPVQGIADTILLLKNPETSPGETDA